MGSLHLQILISIQMNPGGQLAEEGGLLEGGIETVDVLTFAGVVLQQYIDEPKFGSTTAIWAKLAILNDWIFSIRLVRPIQLEYRIFRRNKMKTH